MQQVMVVYDNDGNIVFSQVSDNFNASYNCLVEEFKSNRSLQKVDVQNRKIIWGDSEEMEKAKEELRELKEKELTLKKNLLREELKQR